MIEDAKRKSTSGNTLAAAMVIHACVGGRAGIDMPSIVADKIDMSIMKVNFENEEKRKPDNRRS